MSRNWNEFQWMQFVETFATDNIPALCGYSEAATGSAMEYLEGPDAHMWKTRLMAGPPDMGIARMSGDLLGRIRAAAAAHDFADGMFDARDVFVDMRINPYLRFTVEQHPDLAAMITTPADGLAANPIALVRGDVSPKNIMVHNGGIFLIDAECAAMSDPAFDTAFSSTTCF